MTRGQFHVLCRTFTPQKDSQNLGADSSAQGENQFMKSTPGLLQGLCTMVLFLVWLFSGWIVCKKRVPYFSFLAKILQPYSTYTDGSCSVDHINCSLVIPIKRQMQSGGVTDVHLYQKYTCAEAMYYYLICIGISIISLYKPMSELKYIHSTTQI